MTNSETLEKLDFYKRLLWSLDLDSIVNFVEIDDLKKSKEIDPFLEEELNILECNEKKIKQLLSNYTVYRKVTKDYTINLIKITDNELELRSVILNSNYKWQSEEFFISKEISIPSQNTVKVGWLLISHLGLVNGDFIKVTCGSNEEIISYLLTETENLINTFFTFYDD